MMFDWLRRLFVDPTRGDGMTPPHATPPPGKGSRITGQPDWPDVPDPPNPEFTKIRYQAEVNEAGVLRGKARDVDTPSARAEALEKADWENEYQLDRAFQQAIIDLSKGAIERAKGRAELIEKAAAAIASLYAGLLALVFSVTDNPLPPRGVIPAFFLGLSIALAAIYLAYLTSPDEVTAPDPHSANRENQRRRLRFFTQWTEAAVLNRVHWLRAAVVSIAIGVVLLPIPFVQLKDDGPDSPSPQASVPSTAPPDVPTPPSSTSEELAGILFQAQVNEVATARILTPGTTWPSPPRVGADVELLKIYYQTLIDRSSPTESKKVAVDRDEERRAFGLAAVGLALVVIVPLTTWLVFDRKPVRRDSAS